MKKILLATSLTLAAPIAAADFLGVHAGAGQWHADYSGDLGDPSVSAEELNLNSSKNNFFYVAFEHPIPLIPNARIQHTGVTSSQRGEINREFRLDNETYSGGEEVSTDVDLTHTDFTLYYELLDNWVELDVGLTLRLFDGSIYAEGESGNNESVDMKATVPMLYGMARFQLPLTGLSVGGHGNLISYDGNELLDLTANVRYEIGFVAKFGLELGYRHLALELDEGTYADMELSGPYAGLTFHF